VDAVASSTGAGPLPGARPLRGAVLVLALALVPVLPAALLGGAAAALGVLLGVSSHTPALDLAAERVLLMAVGAALASVPALLVVREDDPQAQDQGSARRRSQ
jgi:membrane protein implicated in regulation of membrane protease activity